MTSKSRDKGTHTWDIYRLKSKPAVFIGTVRAATPEAAITMAIEEFKVTDPPAQARLIAVQRD